MAPSLRTVAVLLLALCGTAGCASDAAQAPTAAAPTSATTSAAPGGEGCSDEPSELPVCRVVAAVLSGGASALSDGEQDVAASVGTLSAGSWTLEACELVGDVTVACEVSFEGETDVHGFTVAPVNAEYLDGTLVTPDDEPVRYEVVSYEGTGPRDSFTAG